MSEAARYDVHDFQREVIERSFKLPVVVDFWAEWCGPCKILGPILERFAGQQSDRWTLAKVDTEELVDEATRYGIQGIPNVKMFFEGKIIGEFIGALPEYSVAQWLKTVLPGKNKNRIEAAKLLLEEQRDDEAETLLENILRDEPGNPEAMILLAKNLVLKDPITANRLVTEMDDPKFSEQRETISTLVYLSGLPEHADHLPDGTMKERYIAAIQCFLQRDFTGALRDFIDIIRDDRMFDDDGSRKACIAIFKYLGENHPVTLQYRREFSSALY